METFMVVLENFAEISKIMLMVTINLYLISSFIASRYILRGSKDQGILELTYVIRDKLEAIDCSYNTNWLFFL